MNLAPQRSVAHVTYFLLNSLQTSNLAFKRNLNAWARLLLCQLRTGRLEAPFHCAPPGGPLRMVPTWTQSVFKPVR